MKSSILALLTFASLSCISWMSQAQSVSPVQDAMVANATVKAVYTLLNSSNNNSCVAPQAKDVKMYCNGVRLPTPSPKLHRRACGVVLNISCANGASAKLSGWDVNYDIVNGRQILDSAAVGIVIEKVDLLPAGSPAN